MFPKGFGYNIWCIGWETPHFEETSPVWGHTKALWLRYSRGGKVPRPSGKILFLDAWTFQVKWPVDDSRGIELSAKEGSHPAGWKRGPDQLLRVGNAQTVNVKGGSGGSVHTVLS